MMKQMFAGAVCALGVTVAVAAPKMSWIPAEAEIIAVMASDPVQAAAVETLWKTTAKAHGVDWDELEKENEDFYEDAAKGLTGVVMATIADSATAKTGTAESAVISMTLPKQSLEIETTENFKDFAIYCFVENAKLNKAALADAVKAMAAANAEVMRLTTEGAWTVLREVEEPEEATPEVDPVAEEEPEVVIAYRLMDGGVVWTVGIEDCAMKQVDAMLAGTAPELPAKTPFIEAFRPEFTQPSPGAACAMVRSVTAIAKRLIPEEEYQAMIIDQPLLDGIGVVTMTASIDAQGAFTLTFKGEMGTPANAEQLRDLALGFKAMASMQMTQMMPEAKALPKFMQAVKISSKDKWIQLQLTVTPDDLFALTKEIEDTGLFEEVEDTTCEGEDCYVDEMDDEELPEMDEAEAEELLKSL